MKLLISLFLLAGCQAGTYVHHAESKYSKADDTLIINDVITRRTGYQRTNGPKKHQVKVLDPRDVKLKHVDGGVIFGHSFYQKID